MLVIYRVNGHTYKILITSLSSGLLIALVWINVLDLKLKGIDSIKEITLKRINYFNFITAVIFGYILLRELSPGDFFHFRVYYIALVLSLAIYVLMSVELIKRE